METNKYLNNKKTILDIGIVSIFPEMFKSITEFGITGNAIKSKIININYWNPRNFCYNKNKNVDDRPYGGGPGMIMNMLPLYNAIQQAKNFYEGTPKVIYLSPQGKKINNRNITNLIKNPKIILVCGRYKGIDERLIDSEIDEEWSIGDYVLTGGELPAMILIDVILRFIPGVLRKKKSMLKDSFYNGLLDHPHYTRPPIVNGRKVPDILLSGNHATIKKWRMKESLKTTLIKRPDLLKKSILKQYKNLLQEILNIE